jgi:hypothetical protein
MPSAEYSWGWTTSTTPSLAAMATWSQRPSDGGRVDDDHVDAVGDALAEDAAPLADEGVPLLLGELLLPVGELGRAGDDEQARVLGRLEHHRSMGSPA